MFNSTQRLEHISEIMWRRETCLMRESNFLRVLGFELGTPSVSVVSVPFELEPAVLKDTKSDYEEQHGAGSSSREMVGLEPHCSPVF